MPVKDPVLIRTSERKDFTRCRQRWVWAYVDRLKPITSKPALVFGDLVHQALAVFYPPGRKRGPLPATTFQKLSDENEKELYGAYDDEGEYLDALELGITMLNGYVEHYGKDPDIFVVSPEQEFQLDIYDSETDEYLCTYVGTFDAVVMRMKTKKIGLLEHKTDKSIPSANIFLPLDEQGGSYWAYGPDWLKSRNILKRGQTLDFILYNFLRKGKPDERPRNEKGLCLNQDGSVSKRQPPPLFHREYMFRNNAMRANLMKRVEHQAWEMSLVRSGELEAYKNPTANCRWDCQFKDMCELHERGDDWESFRDAMFRRWNPYEAHDVMISQQDAEDR